MKIFDVQGRKDALMAARRIEDGAESSTTFTAAIGQGGGNMVALSVEP